jgi:hypothetical protein
MANEIGGLKYNTSNDFIKRYMQLSRIDGKHDGFVNKEFNYYFPKNYQSVIPSSQSITSEDQIMNEIFGSYQGNIPDENALIDTAIVQGNAVQLIPTVHGLSKITGEMGYKYCSLKRSIDNIGASGASLAMKLLTMGIPPGSNIYLFVDQSMGIYDILNTVDNSQFNFTVVFNKATITDPAPNAVATLSKKNNFKFVLDGGLNSNIVDGRNLKFAIEDPESEISKYSGFVNLSDILQNVDGSKIKNTLDRTLLSKYDISLTYAYPDKYKIDSTGKGVDPKKLKAGLTIIDKENTRIRILDGKCCAKKTKHTGNPNWAITLKNRIYAMYNTWLGDSTGGTHALGKKCGDWLQAQRVFDDNLTIRQLERVQRGSILSKSKWFYSPPINIGNSILKSVNTHDRIEKVYSLSIGCPIVIFHNAGSKKQGMPQFYEIYVKNYLLQVSSEDYTRKIQLYGQAVQQYTTIYNEFVSRQQEFTANLSNLQEGSVNIINNLTLPVDNIDSLIRSNVLNVASTDKDIDNSYKTFINSLFALKIVLNISNLDNYEDPLNYQSPKIIIPVIPFNKDNQNQNKINFNMLTNKIQFINKNIDKIKFSLGKLSGNILLIFNILSTLNNNINEDLKDVSIFRYKLSKKGSIFQKQIFLHENIAYVYLCGIVDTYNSIQKLPDIFNPLKQLYLTKINVLGSSLQSILNYIVGNNSQLLSEFDYGTANYSRFQQVTMRRMNPSIYFDYVLVNIEEVLNVLTKNKLVGGARPKTAPKPRNIPSQLRQQGESKKPTIQPQPDPQKDLQKQAVRDLLNDRESIFNDEIFLLEIQAEVPNPKNELLQKIISKNFNLQQIIQENITAVNALLQGSPSVKYASIPDIRYVKKLNNENKILTEFIQPANNNSQKIKVCINNIDVYLADVDDNADGKNYISSLNNYIYNVEAENDKNSSVMSQQQLNEKTILTQIQQYGLDTTRQNQLLNFALTHNIDVPLSYQTLNTAAAHNMNPNDVLTRLRQQQQQQQQSNYNLRNVPGRSPGFHRNLQEQKMDVEGGSKKRKSKKRRKRKKKTKKKSFKMILLKNKKLLKKALTKIKKIKRRQQKLKTKKNRRRKHKTRSKFIR